MVFSMIWVEIRFLWSLGGGSEALHKILRIGEVWKAPVEILDTAEVMFVALSRSVNVQIFLVNSFWKDISVWYLGYDETKLKSYQTLCLSI